MPSHMENPYFITKKFENEYSEKNISKDCM